MLQVRSLRVCPRTAPLQYSASVRCDKLREAQMALIVRETLGGKFFYDFVIDGAIKKSIEKLLGK